MQFTPPLKKGKLLKRYKRFFADIEYKGEVLTAHTPNTGSLKTVPLADTECLFSTSDDPKRKLKYTLEYIFTPTGLAGVNTRTPNTIVHEALLEGLNDLYEHVQPEVKINEKTRIDFVLWSWKGKREEKPKKLKYPNYLTDKNLELKFVEVKNVTMAEGKTAFFPDGVTSRGTKHLEELSKLAKKHTCEILFTVQREAVENFAIAKEIDPIYFKAFHKALKAGVAASAYPVEMGKKKTCLEQASPLKIKI